MKKFVVLMVMTLLFLGTGGMLMAADGPHVEKVNDNLYVIQGLGGNITVLITEEGVLLIDAGNTRKDGETVLKEIAQLTDQPLKVILLTHYHSDHSYGLCAMPADVPVIATEMTAENLKNIEEVNRKHVIEVGYPKYFKEMEEYIAQNEGVNDDEVKKARAQVEAAKKRLEAYKSVTLRYPDETFDKEKVIRLGGYTVRFFFPGPAHTNGEAMVLIEEMNVLVTGDNLFSGMFPYIDIRSGGDAMNLLKIVKDESEKDYAAVIPGHGPVVRGTEGLSEFARYLEYARDEVAKAKKNGMTEEEAIEKVTLEKYSDLAVPQYREFTIRAFYRAL